jgi:hypothetical protein
MLAKNFSAAAGLLSCLLGAVPAFSFPIQVVPHPTTVETVLNAFTPGDQLSSSVAARGVAGFVTVWEDRGDLPGGVKMRFLTPAGAPQGDEVWVDKAGPLTTRPRVASAGNGGFVVAWATPQDAWVQRFDFLGQPLGDKLLINSGQPLDSGLPLDVAMAPDGSFAVIYGQSTFGGDVILARRFDAAGLALGNTVELDSGTLMATRLNARVTAGADGSLLAVWQERAGFYILANRYDAASGSWSGVIQVNGNLFNALAPPAPLLYPDGTGVVVWDTYMIVPLIVAQRLDAKGLLSGGPITVGGDALVTVEPALGADAAGNTFVVWSEDAGHGLLGLVVDSNWSPLGAAVPVGNFGGFSASTPSLAIDGGGRAEVVWTSGPAPAEIPFPELPPPNGADGSSLGIVGQVYSTTFCDSGTQILCLGPGGNRFMAGVTWKNPATGETGNGLSLPLTGDTGAFWFFGDQNLELMVKVLDGTALNGHFWIYAGSLSNVDYTLTVEDISDGLTRTYHNPAGQFASFADVEAFPSAVPADTALAKSKPAVPAATTAPIVGCLPISSGPLTSLCLASGHFAVSAQFTDPRTGLAGAATAVPLTNDTGAFWFFDGANLELMIKVLDGRAINGKFWVFYGALSDVDYTITVTLPEAGEVRTYHNPKGTLASHADTQAF